MARNAHFKQTLDERISAIGRALPKWSASAFYRLTTAVRASSRLLMQRAYAPGRNDDRWSNETLLWSLQQIAARAKSWKRQPQFWSPAEGGPHAIFRSLVGHLFEAYPAPDFLSGAWLDRNSSFEWSNRLHMQVGAGYSIRNGWRGPWPKPTKSMAAHLMHAPVDLGVNGAFRWAHARSLGASPRRSRVIARTPELETCTDDEPFWESVIRFLVAHDSLQDDEVRAIITFVDEQRFQSRSRVWDGVVGDEPFQPEFTLRRRSLAWLRRHMAWWREELQEDLEFIQSCGAHWKSSGHRPFKRVTGETTWTIRELRTPQELFVEGKFMSHCVRDYISHCSRGTTSVWSLRATRDRKTRRVVTLEVLPGGVIWQAKAKANHKPTPEARRIIESWASEAELMIETADLLED